MKQEMDRIRLRISTNHLAQWIDRALLGDGEKTVPIPTVSINYWRKHHGVQLQWKQGTTSMELPQLWTSNQIVSSKSIFQMRLGKGSGPGSREAK